MDLYPFQVEAVAKTVKFLQTTGCCYNASEMGTGKSASTIRSIEEATPCAATALIICPAIVTLVWHSEVQRWTKKGGIKYFVISYDKAAKDKYLQSLINQDWDFLVLDEAHYCKNLKALRTKAVLKHIWPKAKYKICLSGTPMTQSIMDMWPVISKIAPEDFGDYWKFAKTYTNIIPTPFGPKYKFEGVRNHEALRKIMKEKFFFRYTKEEVLKDLPAKTYQCIPLGPEYRIEAADHDAQDRYIALLKESIVRKTAPPTPPLPIATALKQQGLKKVAPVSDFCKNMLDSDTPLVIFFQHTDVGTALETALEKYHPVKIEGATSEGARQKAIDDFQAGKTNVFLGQIKAAGIGVTLTRSSTVVLAELSFSPSDISQAVDRSHRIGQLGAVMIYYFSVVDSLDERIQDILLKKSTTFQKVLAA